VCQVIAFKTLVAAVQAAGLVETLKGKGGEASGQRRRSNWALFHDGRYEVAESVRARPASSARRRMASAIPEKMTLWNG
jgi:hypothetical protein